MNRDPRSLDPHTVERVILAEPSIGDVRLVVIDGPAGAGKTTYADSLASALADSFGPIPILHGDEVYEGWPVVASAPDRIAAFALLSGRVDTWLFDRWRHGYDAEHPRWDWQAGGWGEPGTLPAAPVVILEGVALGSAPLRKHASLSVWVDCDPALRLDRVLSRDGESLREEMQSWQRDEAVWHQLDATAVHCDISVVTG